MLTLAFFFPVASGCVSNEYVIPADELFHQAQLPVAARGKRVRVVQGIGDRRGYPVPPAPPAAPPIAAELPIAPGAPDVEPAPPGDEDDGVDFDTQLDGDVNISVGDGGGASRRTPAPRRMPAPGRPTPAHWSNGWHATGRPAPTGGHLGGWHGGGGHVGGGHFGGGGGGGGGNGGDALVVLAVVVIVVGVLVGVGLVGGEGTRFDGYVQMAPEQPIHLKDGLGQTRELPLAALSTQDALSTVEAKVMDDEGYGIERLNRVPLDRTGGTFKLDSGETVFGLGAASFYGPTANLQLGYFFTRQFGLLMNIALGGSADDQGTIVTRHTFSLELQALPLSKGPLHAGGYADAGFALAAPTNNDVVSGPAGGGGVLVELDLTARMALTLRAGANLAHFDDGWSPSGTAALGVAVY